MQVLKGNNVGTFVEGLEHEKVLRKVLVYNQPTIVNNGGVKDWEGGKVGLGVMKG